MRSCQRSPILCTLSRTCFLPAFFLLLAFAATGLRAQTKAADVPKLLQQLADNDPAVRGSAEAALDKLNDPTAVPLLISALQHAGTNTNECKVLIHTLGKFNDPRSIAPLADQLKGEAGNSASEQLLQMGPLGIQAVVDAAASEDETTKASVEDAFLTAPELGLKVLPPVLKTSKSAAQKSNIVALLADCAAQNPFYEDPPRPAFVEAFLPAASDANPAVRAAFATAIQQLADMSKQIDDPGMGHPDFGLSAAFPALKSLAADPEAQVRLAAIDALGAMGGSDAITILKAHANDLDPSVKQHTATALVAAAPAPAPEPIPNSPSTGKRRQPPAAAQGSDESRKLAKIKTWDDQAAIPKLIPLLGDSSSLVRAAAADKLGKLDFRSDSMNGASREQNLSEVPALIDALKDPHALVRAAAAESLGVIGDDTSAAPLTALLSDSKPKVVVAAANALSALVAGADYTRDVLSKEDHEAAGKALAGLLSNGDADVRHAAISALVNVGGAPADLQKVVPLLSSEDVFLRNQAAAVLGLAFYRMISDPQRTPEQSALEQAAGPTLAAALSDPQTRDAALKALTFLKSPPAAAARPILDILKYNVWIFADGMQRPEIQGSSNGFQGPAIDDAIDVLAKTGSPEAEPLLIKFLNIINPGAGQHAAAGLAILRDPRAIGPLLDVLQTKGAGIQPAAAEALGAFQDPRVVPALIQSLQADNYSQRAASATALSHFRDPRVVPALLHSLTDENADVRVKVAEALGNLGDPTAVGPLGRAATTNYAAVTALGKLKSPASVAPLVSVMQDKQLQVPLRLEAITALEKLADPQAVPALIQTMQLEIALDPSSNLATQCAHALGVIKDPRGIEALRKLIGTPTMAGQVAEQALKDMGVSAAVPQ
jgi:HEAT repeat protein